MTRDPYLWCCVAVIGAAYAISFFLPVCEFDGLHMGWWAFVAFFPLTEVSSLESAFGNLCVWSPNPLLWLSIICLAGKRPHFALVAAILAFGSAGHSLLDAHFFDVAAPDFWATFHERTGAYLWFTSMMLLVVVALAFTVKQWRQTRSLPMLGESH